MASGMNFTFKDLIDLAIGSPESGHVNFYALHVLLSNFAQRLDILDEVIDYDELLCNNVKVASGLVDKSSKYRLGGGADAEDAPTTDAPAEAEAEAPAGEAPPEEEAAPPMAEAVSAHEPEPQPEPEPEPPAASEPEAAAAAEEPAPAAEEPAPATDAAPTPAPEEAEIGTVPSQPLAPTPTPTANEAHTTAQPSRISSRVPSRLEIRKEVEIPAELTQNIKNLGSQINMAMDQLNNVTHLLLDRKADPDRLIKLRELAVKLRGMQLTGDDEISISWVSHEQGVEEVEAELEQEEEDIRSLVSKEPEKGEEEADLDLDQHLCYTTERMLNELLELKGEFCGLTNKVNELAAALLKQDCQRIMNMMAELQEQVREIKLANSSGQESFDALAVRVNNAVIDIVQLKKAVINLDDVKIDKSEVEILLAEKVDFVQLQTKVSTEQMESFKVRLEKQFCEVRNIISTNEKNVLYIIDNLRITLGLDALELDLKDFRDQIEKRVAMIADSLQRYINMTNDECAAAAGRVKVLQDLACLSCDTPCVMRTVERAKVGKLPSAKGNTSMGPLVTYELGSIRKSGVMGYYRKDEFPHAPHAYMKGEKAPMNQCVPRHAGGQHTIHTADEHVQKVVLSKRNAGFFK